MSNLIMDNPPTLYSVQMAEDIVFGLIEDDWSYVLHIDGEFAKIEVLDENNDHVGWL